MTREESFRGKPILTMNELTMEMKVGWWRDVQGGQKKERLLPDNPGENAIVVLKKRTLACSQVLFEKNRKRVCLEQKALRIPARSPWGLLGLAS